MRTIPIKLLNSLIKMAQRKHKIPKSSSFYTVFFQKLEVDQYSQKNTSKGVFFGVGRIFCLIIT